MGQTTIHSGSLEKEHIMGAPNTSKQIPPLVPEREVRNIDLARERRLRGATLIAGAGQSGSQLGASIVGGASGGMNRGFSA